MSSTVKRIIKYGFYAFVLISLGVAAGKYLSGEAVLAALGAFNWLYAPLVLGLTVVYLLLKGARFVVFLNPLVEYGRWAVLRAYLVGQVATLLPAGGRRAWSSSSRSAYRYRRAVPPSSSPASPTRPF